MHLEEPITERRRQTRNSIYRYLYEAKDFCSKQTIARDLSLSLPTVYQNLTELMEAGLVCFSGEHRSTGGRRAKGLSIEPDARYAIGISITETRLRFVAANLRLQERSYRRVYHDPVEKMGDFGGFLANELEIFLDENRIDRNRLLGVGIALPGVISQENRTVTLAPTLSMRDITAQELAGKVPYPTYLENDATSEGYAEWFLQENPRDVVYLLLETGVGGAVLLNGNQYPGDNRRSGEFGHMCVEPGGLLCKCGKLGCLEAYCSARRFSDDLGITLKEFFTEIGHNPEYEALWDDMLRHLAIGINNIRMVLDCDVVLGGFLIQYMQPYLARLKEYVAAYNMYEFNADYLRLSSLPKHSVPLGAALHYINLFIENI